MPNLLINPASLQSASNTLFRREKKDEIAPSLVAAYRKRMLDDPRYDRISSLQEGAMNHIPNSGWAGAAAQMVNGYFAGKERQALEKDYLGQQQQRQTTIDNWVASDPTLDPMVAQMAKDPEFGELAMMSVFKNKLDPKDKPKYKEVKAGGKVWLVNESDTTDRTEFGEADKDLDEVEMIGPEGPGIYNRDKRTGQVVGGKIGGIYNKPPSTVVNIDQKAEGYGLKAQAEASAEIWKDTRLAAQSAHEFKATVQQFREASKGTQTGPVSSYTMPIRQALNEMGLKDDQIPNQEALQSATASMVIADAKKLGTNPTDRDAILMERKSPSLSKTPQGNAIIMNYGERAADRKIREARWMSEYLASSGSGGILGHGWDDYLAQKQAENPLLTPEERKIIEGASGGTAAAPSRAKRPAVRNIIVE